MKTTITARLMILVTFIVTISFFSCKDDEDSPSKTDLISKNTWKVTAFTVDPAYPIFDENWNITGYSNDVFATMDDCSKDDTFKFNSDNTLKLDENASKCDPSDPQTSTGTWSFKSNEAILSFTIDGDTQDFTILELTESVLKLKYSETDGTESFTYTITFSH